MNSGPLVPQTSALTRLRHAPRSGHPSGHPETGEHALAELERKAMLAYAGLRVSEARKLDLERDVMTSGGGVCAAELPHGLVDALGLLEVADVTAIWNDDQDAVGNRLLQLTRDADW